MSIIKFTVPTVQGTMGKAERDMGEIFVAKGQKVKASLAGYVGAPREKGDDGEYRPTEFGRLSLRAAVVEGIGGNRYVLDIEGGLRGVLFATREKKSDKSPDYSGNIELGNGRQLPLFGRKVTSENGSFISLSSGEEEDVKNSGSSAESSAPAPDVDDDIPF